MKKSIKLSTCLLGIICSSIYSAQADTLDALLNDIQNDVIVVEKIGKCEANPYLIKARKHAVAPCKPVVATCPAGATRMPKISKCSLVPSSDDAMILSLLKEVDGKGAKDLGNPLIDNKIKDTGFQCNTDADYGPAGSGVGYTPFCFFDLSKVENVPAGEQRFAVPYYFNGNLVQMSNGSTITVGELNNPKNYQCYAANYKATARCLTLPSGFLNKLGLDH